MKRLYAAADLIAAQLLKDWLQETGVRTAIFNQNAQSGSGEIPFTHAYPEIWLMDVADEERARELVRQFDARTMPLGAINCPHCREDNPSNFASCWQCGNWMGSLA